MFSAIYGFLYLPAGIKSYSAKTPKLSEESLIPLILFCTMRFCTTITLMVTAIRKLKQNDFLQRIFFASFSKFFNITIFLHLQIPYAMLSELFSLKARSMATAVATGLNNILAFIAIKSFYNLEKWFDLPSTMGVYCAIGFIG